MFEVIFQEYLIKLIQPKSLASLAAVILLAVILFVISKKTKFNTKMLAYGALAIAIAFVLSYIRVVRFPNGGSITVASMLPIFVFAYIAGPRAGIAVGLCYGMLQFIQDAYFVHWAQFLLDYPIAFALLGLSGLFKERLYLGAIVGSLGRFIAHFISGIVFFATYAGDQNVFLYSFLYNISYILPDTLICLGILTLSGVRNMINRMISEVRLDKAV
jgi:thiamine transporter